MVMASGAQRSGSAIDLTVRMLWLRIPLHSGQSTNRCVPDFRTFSEVKSRCTCDKRCAQSKVAAITVRYSDDRPKRSRLPTGMMAPRNHPLTGQQPDQKIMFIVPD